MPGDAGDGVPTLPEPTGVGWVVERQQSLARVEAALFGGTPRPLRVSRYVLIERIGSGGSGTVWEAYDPELERKVAVKLVAPPTATGWSVPEARARLLREAQLLARSSHPNIIAVHDVGTYEIEADEEKARGVFVVMELVHGCTLADWLRTRRNWHELRPVFLAAGRALAAAHRAGLVHRDFKPSNVMISEDGHVRVLDFGLARVVGSAPAELGSSASSPAAGEGLDVTAQNVVLGTPPYMAPEQHDGRPSDARADQFAFCVTLYEAIHGERPFPQLGLDELAEAKRAGPPAHAAAAPGTPPRVLRALHRGLSPSPARRFEDFGPLLAELSHDPARRRRQWSLGFLTAAVLIGGGGLLVQRDHARAELCTGVEVSLADTWDDEVADRVRAAFLHDEVARTTFAEVSERLHGYREEWIKARHDVCMASLSGEEHTLAVMDRRRTCLDAAAGVLREITAVLREGGERTLQEARDIMGGLVPISSCGDDESLAHDAVPAAADAVATLGRVHVLTARVRALRLSHRFADARLAAEEAVVIARQLGHPSTLARTLYALGWALAGEERFAEAEARVREGWLAAERHGLDDLSLRGAIDRADLLVQLGRYREAAELVELAEAKSVGRTLPAGIRADLEFQRAAALRNLGHPGRALPGLEGVLEQRMGLFGPDHVAVAWTREALGDTALEHGDGVAARDHYLHARAIHATQFGDESPEVAAVDVKLARVALAAGRIEEAITVLDRRVCAAFAGGDGQRIPRAQCLATRAEVHLAHNNPAVAALDLDAARALVMPLWGEGHPRSAELWALDGEVLLALGRVDEARDRHERALAIRRLSLPDEHPAVRASVMRLRELAGPVSSAAR